MDFFNFKNFLIFVLINLIFMKDKTINYVAFGLATIGIVICIVIICFL